MRPSNADAVVRELVATASIEIIPMKGSDLAFDLVPAGSTLTVTCSSKFGLERTLAYTEAARLAGFTAVPHIAARQVSGRSELAELLRRLAEAGVDNVYVIGGDADTPRGEYASAAELLADLAGLDHGLREIGVACYPEGHPAIPDDVLFDDLCRKQPLATYMVSQMCFDVDAIVRWLGGVRARGIALPLRLGVAAPISVRRLAELSVRIGVGSSLRYLSKQHSMVRNLVLGGAYRPEQLLGRIATDPAYPDLGIGGVHLFSFNQVAATVDWQQRIAAAA
ncbi:hypothetical protein BJF78_11485 [Pseudonocardia sp. CNS-139]|nr:hypothetical protein BJF78_11485 [Pseudonocardia sp. CNS-139]